MNSLIRRLKIILICLILANSGLMAQKSANRLLNDIHLKMNRVKDYSADVAIKADIPFLKILPVKATVYFKQPDNFKVDSKGIAIMPRQGFSDVNRMISDTASFTAIYTGKETVGNINAQIISLIPLSDTGELILAKFWIDATKILILKSQLTTRSNGTIMVEYAYKTQTVYGLPDEILFTVDVKKFKNPKSFSSSKKSKTDVGNKAKDEKGTIRLILTNYQINKGIKDSFFTKKK